VQLIQKSSGAFVEKELFGSTGVSSILGVVRRMNDYLTESKVLVNSVEVEINKNYRFDLEFIFSYLFSEIRKQELIPIFFAYPEYFGVSRTCSGCPRELTNWISAVIYERGPVCGNHNYKLPKYEEREEIIDKIIEKLEYKLTRQEDLLFYCDGYFMSERVKKLRENFTGPGSNILYPRISIELFRSNKEQFLEGLRNWREYSYEEMYDSLDNIIEQNFS
jgi:hypothetical protein